MQELANILATYAMRDYGTQIKRAKRNAIAYLLAGVCGLTALIAALTGAGIYLAAQFGAMQATFVIAGIALTAAITILAVVAILKRVERRRHHAGKALVASTAISLLGRRPSNTPLTLAAAAGLGYLALQAMSGERPSSE